MGATESMTANITTKVIGQPSLCPKELKPFYIRHTYHSIHNVGVTPTTNFLHTSYLIEATSTTTIGCEKKLWEGVFSHGLLKATKPTHLGRLEFIRCYTRAIKPHFDE